MSEITYGQEVYDLAKHFLPEEPEENVVDLAKWIQGAVDDWFADQEAQDEDEEDDGGPSLDPDDIGEPLKETF